MKEYEKFSCGRESVKKKKTTYFHFNLFVQVTIANILHIRYFKTSVLLVVEMLTRKRSFLEFSIVCQSYIIFLVVFDQLCWHN